MEEKGLFYSVYRPEGEVKGCVEVVHGMAEHSARYAPLGKYLSERGWAVVTYDLPGHGKSVKDDRDLGWFGSENGWQALVDSASVIEAAAKKEFPDVPFILMGHSMGTIVARCWLQGHDQEIDGLILSGAPNSPKAAGAGMKLAKVIRTFKGKHGYSKMLDQAVTGNFNKSVENPRTSVDWLSYNTKNVDAYIADKYCGFPFTIQGYIDEMEGVLQMHDSSRYHCTKKDLPIYFFAGEEDPCIGGTEGFADSQNVLKQAGYENVKARLWPHRRHETMNEENPEAVFADIEQWLDSSVK